MTSQESPGAGSPRAPHCGGRRCGRRSRACPDLSRNAVRRLWPTRGYKSLWLFDPGGWEGALDGPSARSTIRLRALLEDLEWQLRPVPNGFMAEGAGTTRTRMLSRESHIEPSLRA